jgi:hypothetical protein
MGTIPASSNRNLASLNRFRMSRQLTGFALMACCLFAASCSRGGPALAPATGRVTYKSKPVANADVAFAPESGEGRIATGRTDSDGRFTLGTFAIGDGAMIGKHRVSVMARGPERPPRPGEVGSGMPGEMMPGDPVIPMKYFAPDSSGLTEEVKRGKNHFDLALPN